jgi:hypothetical protein
MCIANTAPQGASAGKLNATKQASMGARMSSWMRDAIRCPLYSRAIAIGAECVPSPNVLVINAGIQ